MGWLQLKRNYGMFRDKICWHFYDNAENETESVVLDANGEPRCLNVEKGRWHSLECLESGLVLMESKDGGGETLREEKMMSLDTWVHTT